MLPDEAVIVTLPLVVTPDTSETVPADTVATLVLLEVHVATCVMSTEPLHVVAVAVKLVVGEFVVMEPLDGLTAIAVMQPTVTVTVCVPVIVGFWVEVAVTVALPVLTDVTNPAVETVATEVGSMLQVTGALPVLPSLKVPVADI